MIISLLAALDENDGIGKDGRLPWHLSEDLKNFRRLTKGHHVLMGRRTFESIGGQLPGRKLIVLSHDHSYTAEHAQVAHSLEEAIGIAGAGGEEELFVIGGAQVYVVALPQAQRFYLTRVHAGGEVDTYFPPFDLGDWDILEQVEVEPDAKNDFAYSIMRMERRDGGEKQE